MPDLSKPHIARVVDYWLGGSHNYTVDRIAGDKADEAVPGMKPFQQVHRRFLKRVYAYMTLAAGLDSFVDFGSGLPTRGNVHQVVAEFDENARVVYSDYDDEVVQYGEEILAATAPDNTLYLKCRAGHPEAILETEVLQEFLGGERRVGFGFTNLPHLISDEDMASAFRVTYEWAAPGSHVAVSFGTPELLDYPDIAAIEQSLGMERWYRTPGETQQLLDGWQVTEHGVQHTRSWPRSSRPTAPLEVVSVGFVARK